MASPGCFQYEETTVTDMRWVAQVISIMLPTML
jgi:hypothetical protein